jgi:hypothetical protein
MSLMSELAAGYTHDVIHRGSEVVAVVVPIVEYQQLREALAEQRVREEFYAARQLPGPQGGRGGPLCPPQGGAPLPGFACP